MIETLNRVDGPVPYFTADTTDLGVAIAFTTRIGGVSAAPYDALNVSSMVGDVESSVLENRSLIERAVGFAEASITLLNQVHGRTVVDVGEGTCGVVGEGDALITQSSTTVGVLAADCVPVLIAGADAIAAAHAGWRGLVGGVIEAAVERVGDVKAAWVGPSIRACCYQVGEDRLKTFREHGLPVENGAIDTGRAALSILERCGIDRLGFSGECTSCNAELFSHRRDGVTGRQGGFIAWR